MSGTYSADDSFIRDFNKMMRELKQNNNPSLNSLPLSEELASQCIVNKADMVFIRGINDEVYAKLNNTTGLIWTRPDLRRRKFDSNGEYIKKDGNYVFEDVTLPHSCIAFVSDYAIGVKTKYKAKEDFAYVDMISQTINGVKNTKYVYIIPRKYCFRIHQTALVASWNKMTRKFYSSISLATTVGQRLFLSIIDYKYTSANKNYRVLRTGTDPDKLTEFANELIKYWVSQGVIFNPAECEVVSDKDLGCTNLAQEVFEGTMDTYTLCSSYALDKETDIDYSYDMEGDNENE